MLPLPPLLLLLLLLLQCYRHGGLELYSQEVRPLLLRYAPELDEDRRPVGECTCAGMCQIAATITRHCSTRAE
jgi:hypothetical protein